MASLLKNQILKHLSKFTKNLSSDKINLSTFKGEGELSNLELNEDILTQLLELPSWLRITKAVCNRVAVKIQWTKLKSQPICLYLDEVIVETETCQELRHPTGLNQQAFGGKYGFVDRVMDGIFVHVNSVLVKLTSHKFQASLQLSRVKVQSMTPKWQKPSDLRSTRIRDASRGEILLFKEIEWQTTRIEATAVDPQEDYLTPLRLIANQAKIRIVVKKRLSDSAIISSRLILLLDDLLWVLTITQLKAAILYANSLKELIERSSKQSKAFAAEKLKKQGHMQDHRQHQHQNQRGDRQESSTAKFFNDFDVASTSYHLITSRFDLHLCDDHSPNVEDKRHWKTNGGSMQITFYKLSLDMYPFHPAGGERKSWSCYSDNVGSRNPWVQKLFAQFRDEAITLRQACESESTLCVSSSAPSLLAVQQTMSPTHQTSPRSGKRTLNPASSQSASTSPVHSGHPGQKLPQGSRSSHNSPSHHGQTQGSTRLLESCFVVKMEDVTVYMVTTPGLKRKAGHQKLVASDKRHLHLPPEMSVFHLEYTDYFFPEGLHYPVPHANLYILVNPIRVTMDYLTILWSNLFLMTLSKSMDMDFGEKGPAEHVDMKVELVMPRVILPAEESVDGQPDRPEAVQIQASRVVITNCRTDDCLTSASLQTVLDAYNSAKLMSETDFPCDDICRDEGLIPDILYQHASNKHNAFLHQDVKSILDNKGTSQRSNQQLSPPTSVTHMLDCDSLKRLAAADIWAVSAEQVWMEFLGIQNCKNRPVPFVEAIPITLWISMSEYQKTMKNNSMKTNGHGDDLKDNIKGHGRAGFSQHPHHGRVRIDVQRPEKSSSSHAYPPPHQPHQSSPSSMPVLGSSPPVCDNNYSNNHNINNNNTSSSHPSRYHSSSPSNIRSDYSPNGNGRLPRDRDGSYSKQPSSSMLYSSSSQSQPSHHGCDPRDSTRESTTASSAPVYSASLSQQQQESSRTQHHHHHQQQQQYHQRFDGTGATTMQSRQPSHQSRSSSSSRQRLPEADRRPSRLSISPDSNSPRDSSSSRRSKSQHSRVEDSPHNDQRRGSTHSSSSHNDPSNQTSGGHRYGSSNEVYPRSHTGDDVAERDNDYYQTDSRHRRERRLVREDSRSSSSPPIGHHRDKGWRDESKERSTRRNDERLIRQSSSSSSDRRDVEGYPCGDGWRDGNERLMGEGQSRSDLGRGEDDRSGGRWEDHLRGRDREDSGYHSRREREIDGEGMARERASHEQSRRGEVTGGNSRKSRQNSSSSSERGSTVQPSSFARERRLTRSSSRERRDLTYELERQEKVERQEKEKRKPRNEDRKDDRMAKEGDGRRFNYHQDDVRDRQGEQRGDHRRGRKLRDSESDYDNDVKRSHRRSRDSHSRTRESSVIRTKERDIEKGSNSPGKSDRGRAVLYRGVSMSESRSESSPSDSRTRSHQHYWDGSQGRDGGYGQKHYVGNDGEEDREEDQLEDEEEDIDRSFCNHQQMIQQQERYEKNRNGVHHHQSDKDDSAIYNTGSHPSQEDGVWTHQSARPTPEGCKSQDETHHRSTHNSIEKSEPVNKLCVLLSIDGKVRIQVTHFQYLFLLRLSESFSTFQAELSTDLVSNASLPSSSSSGNHHRHHHQQQQQFCAGRHSNSHNLSKDQMPYPSSSVLPTETEIVVPLVLKEIELAVVCPYQMHQRTFSDDLSVMSPFLGGIIGGQDAVFGDDGDSTCFPGLTDNRHGRRARDDSTLQRLQQTISFKSNSSGQLENITHLTPQTAADHNYGSGKGLSSSLGSSHHFPAVNQSSSNNAQIIVATTTSQHTIPFQSEWNSRKESSDTISQSVHSFGRDSGIGVERKSKQSSSRQEGGRSGSKSGKGVDVKKSFTSAFSSFTDKIKNKMEGLDDNHDDFDSMSIRTDTSDDDFELLSLEDAEEAPAFAHQQPPPHEAPSAEDIYSELVDPGDSVSMYAESSTTKGKEMVYIVLFKLDNTEILASIDNTGTTACVQLSKLVSIQLGNVAYEDFYSRFSTARGYIQEELSKTPNKKSSPLPGGTGSLSSATSPPRCPIRLKFTIPVFDPTLNLAPDPGFMTVTVEDYCQQFKMSGLICLADFVEDEKLPETVPMSITVHNLLLVLEEDRPPANITSPGAVPMNLCIKHVCIDRTKDGMFHIAGSSGSSPSGDNSVFKFPSQQQQSPYPGQGPATNNQTVKPHLVSHATSPITSPDGTMSLLMASQNENVLLRRQLEEVKRANNLYEHQLLQWRDAQDGAKSGGGSGGVRVPMHKRQSFTSDMLSGSPSSSSGVSDSRGGLVGNHVSHSTAASSSDIFDREEMERENLRLQHQIVKLEDDLLTVSKEKESLLQTLKLLQDELLMSERMKRTPKSK